MVDIKFPTRYTMRRAIGETDFSPSLTVPDQSMTVLEILQRFAQGVDPGISKVPIYDGEDFDDPFTSPDFDLADVNPDDIKTSIEKANQTLNALNSVENSTDDDDKTTTTNE